MSLCHFEVFRCESVTVANLRFQFANLSNADFFCRSKYIYIAALFFFGIIERRMIFYIIQEGAHNICWLATIGWIQATVSSIPLLLFTFDRFFMLFFSFLFLVSARFKFVCSTQYTLWITERRHSTLLFFRLERLMILEAVLGT